VNLKIDSIKLVANCKRLMMSYKQSEGSFEELNKK